MPLNILTYLTYPEKAHETMSLHRFLLLSYIASLPRDCGTISFLAFLSFSALTLLGWAMRPVTIVPKMTYYMLG